MGNEQKVVEVATEVMESVGLPTWAKVVVITVTAGVSFGVGFVCGKKAQAKAEKAIPVEEVSDEEFEEVKEADQQ